MEKDISVGGVQFNSKIWGAIRNEKAFNDKIRALNVFEGHPNKAALVNQLYKLTVAKHLPLREGKTKEHG